MNIISAKKQQPPDEEENPKSQINSEDRFNVELGAASSSQDESRFDKDSTGGRLPEPYGKNRRKV